MTSRRAGRGFTLVELVVVMALIMIVGSAVSVSLIPALKDARLRHASSMVIATLGYARSYAAARQKETRVVFTDTRDGLEVQALVKNDAGEEELQPVTTQSGRFRRLPDGVRIESVQKPSAEEEQLFCGFTPLGQTDETTITLADEHEKRRVIHVNPITGQCTIEVDSGNQTDAQ